MRSVKLFTALSLVLLSYTAMAQNGIVINSPGKVIQVKIEQQTDGALAYSVYRKDQVVILPSGMGFKLNKPVAELNKFNITAIDSLAVNESWKPVWGEVKMIQNNYRQTALTLADKKNSGIIIKLIVRVLDDGAAFRYEFPEQKNLKHFVIGDENTLFKLAGNHKAFWIPGDFDTNEFRYTTSKITEVDVPKIYREEDAINTAVPILSNRVQTPLMLKSEDGLYINIHEAALVNYPAMHLLINKGNLSLSSQLAPDAVGNKAYLITPAVTPWRTIIVSNKATEILSSKMILNLNEPSVIKDPSFIQPQKFIGVWWEMFNGKSTWDSTSGKHGATTANVKKYIDFAAKHGINSVLVEGWNRGWEDWIGNWKENVFDFVTPYPDFNLKEVNDYAKAKGIKMIMHHETSGSVANYERHLDRAFELMQQYGYPAVKSGYVGKIIPRGEFHDGQTMVNHYNFVAQRAADYKLMINSHESSRPTGYSRTYPNYIAAEAARGNEFNAWSIGNPPMHETILPFTRLLGGPMDYTPGIFEIKMNVYDPAKKEQVHTTLAKQLALYVTMYSPLQMAADLPENYEKHLDAFQFIKDVAVNWDQSLYIEAEPGDYLTVARKTKGKDEWFLGAITDENARKTVVSLNFLTPGKKYKAIIYEDGKDAHWEKNPKSYAIKTIQVTSNSKIKLNLANGGGTAISFTVIN